MMPASVQSVLLYALERHKGDSLERAELAFSRFSPEQMQLQHGASGLPRQVVLDGYRQERERVLLAIEWVRKQPVEPL